MTVIENMPVWAAWLTSFLVLFGAGLTLIGNIGLARLPNFYARVHAPTLGTTLGGGAILIAAIVYFSAANGQAAFYPVLIAVFMTLTTPITLILLARAAVYRDRSEGNPDVPRSE